MDELIRDRSAMTLEVAISPGSSDDVIALNWWLGEIAGK